jgi:hypothetical protein
LLKHETIHTKKCDLCGRKFKCNKDLIKHKKGNCDVDGRFGKRSENRSKDLEYHKSIKDIKECGTCNKKFKRNIELIMHMKLHCDVCGKFFKSRLVLDYHKSIKECQKIFNNEDFLNSHQMTDHNINNCDLQGLNNFVDCSPSLDLKIKEECDFKQEIKEEVIDDDINPFVDCDKGIKEEAKEDLIVYVNLDSD